MALKKKGYYVSAITKNEEDIENAENIINNDIKNDKTSFFE